VVLAAAKMNMGTPVEVNPAGYTGKFLKIEL
jgi:hypothetical protein